MVQEFYGSGRGDLRGGADWSGVLGNLRCSSKNDYSVVLCCTSKKKRSTCIIPVVSEDAYLETLYSYSLLQEILFFPLEEILSSHSLVDTLLSKEIRLDDYIVLCVVVYGW